MSFLVEMAARKRRLVAAKIAAQSSQVPPSKTPGLAGENRLRTSAGTSTGVPPFTWDGFGVIAEIKRASPSLGDIADHPLEGWAQTLHKHGAKALSVLTEADFFKGDLAFIPRIRVATSGGIPLLRKDFIVDPFELDEAVAVGASAVLLIVAMLGEAEFLRLSDEASKRGLGILAEVHDANELDVALQTNAWLGINQRNLHTLQVDTRYAEKLVGKVPSSQPFIVESGLRSGADLKWAKSLGAKGVLVGEGLARHADPGAELSNWLADLGAQNGT